MRTKAEHAVVARTLNRISESQGSMITVLATPGYKLPKNPALASFTCKGCDTHFAAHRGSKPFCVTCGCDDVKEDAEADATPEKLTDDQELAGVVCCHCHNTNIVSLSVASKLSGAMHCVVCGSDLGFDDITSEEEDTPEEDGVDPLEEETVETQGQDFTDPDDVFDEDGAEEGSSTTDRIEEEKNGQEDLNPPVGVENLNQTSIPLLDPNAEVVDVPMDEINPDDINADDVAVIQTSSAAYFMVKGVSVASLTVDGATEAGVDLFNKGMLERTVKASIARNGLKATLNELGFKSVIAKFPLKKLVDVRVSAALAAETAKVDAKVKGVADDFKQSLLIAMASLQKNFFRGKTNALKSALFDELTAASVRSPDKLIDRVFRNHGGAYLSTLMDLATELMQKPIEARNALAEAVDAANYMDADKDETEEDEDGDDDMPESTSARLAEQAGVTITQRAVKASTATDAPISRQKLFGTMH